MTKAPAKFKKEPPTTVGEVASTTYPLELKKMIQVQNPEKVTKKNLRNIPKHVHIFRPWQKNLQNFKKNQPQLWEELHRQGTYMAGKMTKFKTQKK